MESGNSLAFEVKRYKLGKEGAIRKSSRKLSPIFLPEKPEENWTYKNRPLSPIYLPNR